MKFKTNISMSSNGRHTIAGREAVSLIGERSFVDLFFLLFKKRFPEPREKKLLDAMLVAACEHGIDVPSAYVPRVVASAGSSYEAAVAAGILSIGRHHGGAVEVAAQFLLSDEDPAKNVEAFLAHSPRVPGFGHRLYNDTDPRAEALFAKVRDLGFSCIFLDRALRVKEKLGELKKKTLLVNIDGALAVCALELGFDVKAAPAFFIVARTLGAAAHVYEELKQNNAYHRLDAGDVERE